MTPNATSIEELLGSLPWGSTILIENRAPLGVEVFLTLLLKEAEKRGAPLIIEDILDTFPVYAKHFELLGKGDLVEKAGVLKIGGTEEAGRVLNAIRFDSDPQIYITHYRRALEEVVPKKEFFDVVLGMERLFAFHNDPSSMYHILYETKRRSINRNQLTLYIVEANIMKKTSEKALLKLEEIADSVWEVEEEGNTIKIRLRKDPALFELGAETLLLNIEDVL